MFTPNLLHFYVFPVIHLFEFSPDPSHFRDVIVDVHRRRKVRMPHNILQYLRVDCMFTHTSAAGMTEDMSRDMGQEFRLTTFPSGPFSLMLIIGLNDVL